MSFYASYPFLSGSGVTSVNTLTGAVTLAAGSGISITPSGNTLTIADTGIAKNCWSGYHSGLASGWSTNSTSYADPSAGVSQTLTQIVNSGMGTVTTAASSLPGILLTFPTTGIYFVIASVATTGGASTAHGIRLVDGSSTIIDPGQSSYNISGSNGSPLNTVVQGLYSATSGSPSTIKLQLATISGTQVSNITSASSLATTGSAQISWTIIQM